MSDQPAAGAPAGESKEPETPKQRQQQGEDALLESSPWLRAKSVAESMNLQAVMEDMERRYFELRQERDTLQEKVKTMTTEKESLVASQASVSTIRPLVTQSSTRRMSRQPNNSQATARGSRS